MPNENMSLTKSGSSPLCGWKRRQSTCKTFTVGLSWESVHGGGRRDESEGNKGRDLHFHRINANEGMN